MGMPIPRAPLVLASALAVTAVPVVRGDEGGGEAFAAGRHVVVLGSSTAYGMGPSHPDSAWVNRFRAAGQAADPGRVVTNLSWPGYTTYHIMPDGFVPPAGRPAPDPARNVTEALDLGADAILVNLPSNDAVNGWSVQTQLANYDVVLAEADAAGVPVWISTTQPRNTTSEARANLMAMRDSTLARWGDMAMDFWSEIANPNGTINALYDSGDGVHLNNLAHGILFQRVDAKNVWQRIAVGVPATHPAPLAFRLHAAAPNPVRGATTLSYTLDAATRVRLELFDVRGRRLGVLQEGDMPDGTHRVLFDASGLAHGVYFYRLETTSGSSVGRMVRIE